MQVAASLGLMGCCSQYPVHMQSTPRAHNQRFNSLAWQQPTVERMCKLKNWLNVHTPLYVSARFKPGATLRA